MILSPTEAHQHEMRDAFYDGAPGILVSGLVWMTAALICFTLGTEKAVWTLLGGGALIHPLGTLVTKALGRPAKTSSDNALNQLAAASTIWLILCCAMAFGLFLLRPALFFPAMLATIGSRYLIFAAVFGRPVFWALGVSLIVAAMLTFSPRVLPALAAGLGGVIEVLFACLAFSKASGVRLQGPG